MLPRLAEVELDHGDEDEQHHRPPRDAVQRGDHIGLEHEGTIIGEHRAEHAGAEQNAADNLHHHQGRPVIGAKHAPHEPRHCEDDRQGDQVDFGKVHPAAVPVEPRLSVQMRFPHAKPAFPRLTRCSKSSRADLSSAQKRFCAGRRAGEPDASVKRGAAPKEQPPRKLSGPRTARLRDTLESVPRLSARGHRRGGGPSL